MCTGLLRKALSVSPARYTYLKMSAKHLVIQANGLYGNVHNWKVINEHFQEVVDPNHYHIHPSKVNQYRKTFEGIDVCGERLATEITELVQGNPNLSYISLLGHSMGGLMIRYAAGKLFDPDTKTIAGLEPIHCICMATPHLGCDSSGESQVPLVGWLFFGNPRVGGKVDRFVSSVTQRIFRDAGKQLFLEDRCPKGVPSEEEARQPSTDTSKTPDEGDSTPVDAASTSADHTPPLIAKLAFDVPNEGYFYSALKAFRTRTCYGNAANDHIVGWANSTLRYADELPELNLNDRAARPKAMGVVHEDPLEYSWKLPETVPSQTHSLHASVPVDTPATAGANNGAKKSLKTVKRTESKLRIALQETTSTAQRTSSQAAQSSASSPKGSATDAAAPSVLAEGCSTAADEPGQQEQQGVPNTQTEEESAKAHADVAAAAMKISLRETADLPRAAVAAVVLERLRSGVSWARIDCAWRDSLFSAFAHNNIQGKSVCLHLAKRFSALEEHMSSSTDGYCAPISATAPDVGSAPSSDAADATLGKTAA